MKKALSLFVACALLAGLAGCSSGASSSVPDTGTSVPASEADGSDSAAPATQSPEEETAALADLPREDDNATLTNAAAVLDTIDEELAAGFDNGSFASIDDAYAFLDEQMTAAFQHATVEYEGNSVRLSFWLDGIDYGTAVLASSSLDTTAFESWQTLTSSLSNLGIDLNHELRSATMETYDVVIELLNAEDTAFPLYCYATQQSDLNYDALHALDITPSGLPETSYTYDEAAYDAILNWMGETGTYLETKLILPMRCGDDLVVTCYCTGMADALTAPDATGEDLAAVEEAYGSMTETLTNLCTALMEDTDAAHVTVQYRDAIHSAITYLIIEDGVLTHDAAA